mmetsp:Transcript_23400/g.88869  ORF Transcript_23400/g.88869 Transcript_23400/m.88869 type:complete len:243 (-) Transcript_23400:785-1513(-)
MPSAESRRTESECCATSHPRPSRCQVKVVARGLEPCECRPHTENVAISLPWGAVSWGEIWPLVDDRTGNHSHERASVLHSRGLPCSALEDAGFAGPCSPGAGRPAPHAGDGGCCEGGAELLGVALPGANSHGGRHRCDYNDAHWYRRVLHGADCAGARRGGAAGPAGRPCEQARVPGASRPCRARPRPHAGSDRVRDSVHPGRAACGAGGERGRGQAARQGAGGARGGARARRGAVRGGARV